MHCLRVEVLRPNFAESDANFTLMEDVWRQAMSKLCHYFTMTSQWFDYIESSVHAPDHLTQSLVSSGAVPPAQRDAVAGALRRHLWQPLCPRDTGAFFPVQSRTEPEQIHHIRLRSLPARNYTVLFQCPLHDAIQDVFPIVWSRRKKEC